MTRLTGLRQRLRRRLSPPTRPRRPVPNKGDTAWMLTCTALVLLMSVPALALFYGGMVRSKNMLSVLMQVFVVFSLISVLWCVYGYSLAFTEGNAFFGGFDRLFLKGTVDPFKGEFALGATFSKATPMPEIVFVGVPGDVRGDHLLPDPRRVRRAHEVLGGADLHGDLVHVRLRCRSRTWCGSGRARMRTPMPKSSTRLNAKAGCIWQMGRARLRGRHGRAHQRRRRRPGRRVPGRQAHRLRHAKRCRPHNLPMTMIGASLLWFGWFGFNAGSALEANSSAALAFINTYPRDRLRRAVVDVRRVDVQGQAVDARCGVGRGRGPRRDHAGGRQRRHPGRVRDRARRGRGLPVGRHRAQELLKADDSLDVFGVHAVGGILGALLTGVFNSPDLGGPGFVPDWVTGDRAATRHRGAAADPGQGGRHHGGLDRRWSRSSRSRSPTSSSGCA